MTGQVVEMAVVVGVLGGGGRLLISTTRLLTLIYDVETVAEGARIGKLRAYLAVVARNQHTNPKMAGAGGPLLLWLPFLWLPFLWLPFLWLPSPVGQPSGLVRCARRWNDLNNSVSAFMVEQPAYNDRFRVTQKSIHVRLIAQLVVAVGSPDLTMLPEASE